MRITREKDLSVETLRGAAIILVVMGHVIGSSSEGGMKVPDDSFLRHLYYTFEYLRMPLFTVISGWVYALHPANQAHIGDFMIKKVRRIIFPLIFVGISYFLLQYLIPGTNKKSDLSEIWKIFVLPYTLFWYLPSLFLVFVVVAVIDAFRKMENFISWIFIFCMAIGVLLIRDLVISQESLNYFSYKGAIYLLPFFVIGIGIQRFNKFFTNKIFIVVLIIILIVSIIIQQLAWYHLIEYNFSRSGGIGLLIGLTGTILLFRLRWRVKWLIWIGSFAYSIYLFHAFGTAGGRIIIKATGMNSTWIIFMVSLLIGMILPIIVEKLLDRFKLTRMLFLGRSYSFNNKSD
jgi:glucans biosynthesis protein C